MSKEILKEDVGIIQNLAQKVIGRDICVEDMERMGGMTNRTYKVVLSDGSKRVFRVPGEGTEKMIDRQDEKISTELAVKLGIDVTLYYFDEEGRKITEYVEEAVTMTPELLRKESRIKEAAEIFRKLHTSGVDTKVTFEVFDMADTYEKIISNNGVSLFHDYRDIKAEIDRIKKKLDKVRPAKKVPCHNDSLCENWIEGNGRLYLIDWEYAGMNDAMWDLADISIEADYNEAQDELLLWSYFGRKATLDEKKGFMANKLYLDYLWTLWGLTRVPFEAQEMKDYAQSRYDRLKKNLGLLNKV